MLGGSHVTTAWRALGSMMDGRLIAMESIREYIKLAAADSRQGGYSNVGVGRGAKRASQ
jgi:hypothetical protein